MDGIDQRNRDNVGAAERNHDAEFAFVNLVDGADSVARRQHAIEGAGRASALDVSQHDVAGFEPGAMFEFARQDLADAAQAYVTKLIFAHVGYHRCAVRVSTSLANLAPSATTTMLK